MVLFVCLLFFVVGVEGVCYINKFLPVFNNGISNVVIRAVYTTL